MNRRALMVVSRLHVSLYRATGGRLGGRLARAPVLLLTTTGRRSGKRRTTPLLYVQDAGRYVIVASVGGAPKHPSWYLNLRDDPAATIQVGARRIDVSATTASTEERGRLWALATQLYAGYDDYQARTSREIPVVVLTPVQAGQSAD